MPPTDNPQPIEIPWTLLATTRNPTDKSLSTNPPTGSTLSVFVWEPETTPETSPHKGKRIIYYKFTVTFAPLFLTFGGPDTSDFDLVLKDQSYPARIGVLTLRLTADKGIAYFADAVPRKRTIQEDGFGSIRMSSQGSSSLSVGKSNSTLHDSTTTSVTTTTDPGTSWGVDLFVVGVGGTTDTEQTTSTAVTRDASQNLDVTQRDASNERSELFNYTTRLSNTLSILDASHLGSSDLRFTLWAPPVLPLPNVLPNNPEQAYIDALRWRSSGLTGVQDFFATVIADEDAKVCLEANLDSVHVAMPPHPAPLDMLQEPDDAAKNKVLDYLYKKYPIGFPIDDLDVDLADTARVYSSESLVFSAVYGREATYADLRQASVALWFYSYGSLGYHRIGLVGESVLAGGFLDSLGFLSYYKPFKSVWLEAVTDEYRRSFALDFETMAPYVNTESLKVCLSPNDGPAAPADFTSSVALLDVDFSRIGTATSLGLAATMIDQALTANITGDNRASRYPIALSEPKIRSLIIKTAANTKSKIDLSRASDLGFSQKMIESARQSGITTLGQFAAHIYEKQSIELNKERAAQAEEFLKRLKPDEERGCTLLNPIKRFLAKIGFGSRRNRRSPVFDERDKRD